MSRKPTLKPQYDEAKLRQLLLYVALKCESSTTFGQVKLNKILFYADFLAYQKFGKPITGAVYTKQPMGPAVHQMLPVQAKLIKAREAVLKNNQLGGYLQKRLVALVDPDLSMFTADEIAVVDTVITQFEPLTAAEVSGHSHGLKAWKLAKIGEPIPYFTALLGEAEPLDATEMRWALGAVERANAN